MEQKVVSIEKNLDKKFLKFYTANYITNGKPRKYFFVSRHDEKELALKNKEIIPTAIEAFTYFYDNEGEMNVVMIEEFRSAIGRYVTSFTAGLIEKGEDVNQAITREVKEEIGADVKRISLLQNYPLTMCAGMTDEANYMAIVEVENIGEQHLEETEDIKVKIYRMSDLHRMVQRNEIYLSASGYLGYLALYNEMV